jgi:hypothetical protein
MQRQAFKIPDCVLMYASLFTYTPSARTTMVQYMSKIDYALINQYESKGSSIPSDSSVRIKTFMESGEEDQRELFDGGNKQ